MTEDLATMNERRFYIKCMTVKEIDNLLKNSFALTNEEKEKYSKEILTDEEIKKLKAIMTNPESNSVGVEDDFVLNV